MTDKATRAIPAHYYQIIFECAYDAVFIETLEGQILDANPAACRLTGYSREELVSMHVSQLLPAGSYTSVEDIVQQEVVTGGYSFTGWNVRKDGTHVRVEVRVTSFIKDGQELAIVIAKDITARVETEFQANRERVLLQSLHELAIGLMQRHELLDVLHSIVHHACQLFETANGYFYMLSDEPDMIEIKVGHGDYRHYVGKKRRIGTGLSGTVWQTGELKVIEDYQKWSGRDPDPMWQFVGAAIGIPIKSHDKVVGVIGLDLPLQSQVRREECVAFERLAELASLAIDNVFLLKELHDSREQFHSLFANMAEGVALHEGVVDEEGRLCNYRIIDINPRYTEILGIKREDAVGKLATEVYHTETAPYLEEYSQAAVNRQPYYFEAYFAPYQKYFSVSTVPWQDKGFATIFNDITERKETEQKLLFTSYYDALTGVFNRAYFEAELRRLEGVAVPFAMIIADVDDLKLTNDMFGHGEGDRLLLEAAELLNQHVRPQDIVARIGGDEFAVIMENAREEDVLYCYETLRQKLDQPAAGDDAGHIPLKMSLGYAISTAAGANPLELFRLADNRMYRNKLHRRVNSRSSTVHTLKRMLAARDYLTEGHGERLQDMAVSLAKALGWSDTSLDELKLFAQFHDIGKVGIPDRILQKNGPLTPEERDSMNRHSEIGHRIAQASEELLPIADWILKHHEHWDGNGYPLGIKSEEIPIECRILAIVDAYDAMTSDRPYRRARSSEAAVAEILRCAGTQFDPELAVMFAQMIQNGKIA